MDRFSKYNPRVTFLFFALAFVLTLIFFNPIFLSISFLSSFVYKFVLDGKSSISYLLRFIMPFVIFVAVFNMIFARYGETVFFSFKDISFTFEALFYGICQGIMFGSVIMWFSCYGDVIDSKRFLAVFGSIVPNLAFVFSLVISFIPRLRKNAREINDARFLIDNKAGKLKKSISNFSALLTMTLEETIEVADSMKARGFGKKRTVYSKYKFSISDLICLCIILIFAVILFAYKATGRAQFIFEPVIQYKKVDVFPIIIFILFLFLPVIIDVEESLRWRSLKQKI